MHYTTHEILQKFMHPVLDIMCHMFVLRYISYNSGNTQPPESLENKYNYKEHHTKSSHPTINKHHNTSTPVTSDDHDSNMFCQIHHHPHNNPQNRNKFVQHHTFTAMLPHEHSNANNIRVKIRVKIKHPHQDRNDHKQYQQHHPLTHLESTLHHCYSQTKFRVLNIVVFLQWTNKFFFLTLWRCSARRVFTFHSHLQCICITSSPWPKQLPF